MNLFSRFLKWGSLILLAAMPFHAFLSVWLGQLFGHRQLWQAWKEVLLGLMALVALGLLRSRPELLKRWRQPAVYLLAGFAGLSLVVTLTLGHSGIKAEVVGAKTDLEFLLAFGLALLAANHGLSKLGTKIILITSAIVAGFTLIEAWWLPPDFLRHFGYGTSTIQPFETIAGHIRYLSTLGGPNQLGSFLILPLTLTVALLIRRPKWWLVALGVAEILALYFSFSRSAWIGAAAAGLALVWLSLPKRTSLGVSAFIIILLAGFGGLTHGGRDVLLHGGFSSQNTSDTKHLLASESGVRAAIASPLGRGLGSAGPASYYSSQPLIPEDYYLQLAIETGWLGLILFLLIEIAVGWQLWSSRNDTTALALLTALLGVSVINLFLQGWADSSTALVFWIMAGLVLGEKYVAA